MNCYCLPWKMHTPGDIISAYNWFHVIRVSSFCWCQHKWHSNQLNWILFPTYTHISHTQIAHLCCMCRMNGMNCTNYNINKDAFHTHLKFEICFFCSIFFLLHVLLLHCYWWTSLLYIVYNQFFPSSLHDSQKGMSFNLFSRIHA